MMHRHVMGKEGMALATFASLGMFAIAYFLGPRPQLTGDMGICLPSPNMWGMTPFWGWIANMSALMVSCVVLYLVNKEFTFVQGSDTVLTGMFAIMVSSNIWTAGGLTCTSLLVLANLMCLVVLFGCYRKRNAAQELCVIATILSLGSMIQYAFIFMIPVYLIGAIMMKCLNFKSFVAFILGLIAPYWIGIGLGIIGFEDFTMPTMTNLFSGFAPKNMLLVGLLNIALTVLIGFILALTNWVKLYAGNTQRRLYNMVINLLGLCAVVCVIFDSDNMLAYLATLYMITAIQLANHFMLRNVYYGSRWMAALSLLYIAGFVLMLRL